MSNNNYNRDYNGSNRPVDIPPNTNVNRNRRQARKKKQNDRRFMFVSFIIVLVIALLIPVIVTSVRGNKDNKNETKAPHSEVQTKKPQESKKPEETKKPEESKKPSVNTKYSVSFDTNSEYAENHKYCVGINRNKNVVTVYGKDKDNKYTKPVKAILCSCGKKGGNDTPAGTFKTADRVRWLSLVDGTYGQYTTRIDGHIWFHSVPYYGQDPSRLEYDEYNKLGDNASLGCVRVNVEDAKWLYENLDFNTIVKIYDDENPGPLGKPKGNKIDTSSPNKGWDPTDPDPINPWNK